MRWFGWMFAMSVCIAMVGCGATGDQPAVSIWQMSQDDFTADTEMQEAQLAKLDSLESTVNRLADRLDDQQRNTTSTTSLVMEGGDEEMQDDAMAGSSLSWGYQPVSLQTSPPTDLKTYIDDKFAEQANLIEESCQCTPPVMSAQASTELPELFEPPEITPSVTDRVISSRIISTGQPVITSVGQPVTTTYSSPMSSFSSPVIYGNSGGTMNCLNGVCPVPQQTFTYQKSRRRNRR